MKMVHPDLPDVSVEVTEQAFRHWSQRGWRRADTTETALWFQQFTHPTYDEEE